MNENPEAVDPPERVGVYGFNKADRLLQRPEFIDLSTHGTKLQNRYFVVFARKSAHQCCRLGVTVTKKVGHAPNRNRIKRVAREYFRLHRQMFKNPWDINLIAKKEASDISNKILFLSLENLFARIAALNHA